MPNRKKIGLIGAGNIGGELARLCANEELGDVFLYDIPEKESFAKGKALDLEQNGAVLGYDSNITRHGATGPICEGADVLIVTAGIPRKPVSRATTSSINLPSSAMSRENAKKVCPDAFVIVISNPLDAMVYEYKRVVGLPEEPRRRHGGRARLRALPAFPRARGGRRVKDVRAMVLGGHGDDMVPVLPMTTINGIPVTSLIAKDKLDAIVERTRKGGGEIVKLMGTSAYYAPASSAVAMAKAYLHDEKRILPCAAYLDGEYGYKDLYMGVPVVLGGKGVEKIIDIPLTGRKGHACEERQERPGGRRHLQEGLRRSKSCQGAANGAIG